MMMMMGTIARCAVGAKCPSRFRVPVPELGLQCGAIGFSCKEHGALEPLSFLQCMQ